MPLVIDGKGQGVTEMAKPKHPKRPQEKSVFAEFGGARQLPESNYDMLNALARVEQIQQGMNPAVDSHPLEYLREARSGGMYDADPDK